MPAPKITEKKMLAVVRAIAIVSYANFVEGIKLTDNTWFGEPMEKMTAAMENFCDAAGFFLYDYENQLDAHTDLGMELAVAWVDDGSYDMFAHKNYSADDAAKEIDRARRFIKNWNAKNPQLKVALDKQEAE